MAERTLVREAASSSKPVVLDGKWSIEKKLGQGGMGTVYLAKDLELERMVAIKMMASELADDPSIVARFEREARMMARLDHPNLVPIYAVGRDGHVPFIVMKLLGGLSLSDYLRRQGRLEMEAVLALVKQICAGLQFVHERGVVHRDLKPANMFVAPNGHVTLLDFGVARDTSQSMTRSGAVVGTPRYMAPEQILGRKVDFRADLYALAIIVFEMVVGRPVFDANSDFSVMKAHIEQAPPDPQILVPLPGGFATALLRGMAKNPDERFDSAEAFYAALDAGSRTELVHRSTSGEPKLKALPAQDEATPMLGPPAAHPRQGRPVAVPAPTPTSGPNATPAPTLSTDLSASTSQGALVEHAAVTPKFRWALVVVGIVLVGSSTWAITQWLGQAPVADSRTTSARPPNGAVDADVVETAKTETERASSPATEPASRADRVDQAQTAESKPTKAADRDLAKAAVPAPSGPVAVTVMTTVGGRPDWAYVDVNGIRKAATPFKLTLDPGKYELVFRRQGYQVVTRQLVVRSGEPTKLIVELKP